MSSNPRIDLLGLAELDSRLAPESVLDDHVDLRESRSARIESRRAPPVAQRAQKSRPEAAWRRGGAADQIRMVFRALISALPKASGKVRSSVR